MGLVNTRFAGLRTRVRAGLVIAAAGSLALCATQPADAEAASKPRCFGKPATMVVRGKKARGTNGPDVIVVARKEGARVHGRGGDDLICGRPGNDILNGGRGDDRIKGGDGHDRLVSGPGRDVLRGQRGLDSFQLKGKRNRHDAKPDEPVLRTSVEYVRLFLEVFGNGAVTGGQINCTNICPVPLPKGYQITLTAKPNPGATFLGWEDDCAGAGTSCSLTMNRNHSVNARFTD